MSDQTQTTEATDEPATGASEVQIQRFLEEARRMFKLSVHNEQRAMTSLRAASETMTNRLAKMDVSQGFSGYGGFDHLRERHMDVEKAVASSGASQTAMFNLFEALGLGDEFYAMRMEFYPEV